ncbi:MAG TPA: TolC family protein [Bryobacteraceae bacterium]|jgi:outer membrane protein TolC|nr:TolC family protein [Bryobacteraceae bacterium]
MVKTACAVLLLEFAAALPSLAQITLEQAVNDAASRYPAVQVSQERVSAAAAGINLARAGYLPHADFLGQINRATHNNVFGLMLPQPLPVISSISGPVLRTNSLDSVWGTAVGGLVSWEPFDFGLRRANIEVAESGRRRAQTEVGVTRLQVAAATADTFLTILAAQQTVVAAKAGVERARVLDQVVQTLVKNELRPGAEASRTRAELALAETQVIRAEQSVEEARAALAQLLGVPPAQVSVQSGNLLQTPPETGAAPAGVETHPLAVAQTAAIDEVKAREKALDRSLYPRFTLEGTLYARGTGVQPDGSTGNAASGLGPNTQNWGLGMSVTFPLFERYSIRVRKEIEQANERTESARYQQIRREIEGRIEKAKATLAGARRVADNTPVLLASARTGEQQAAARYKAGLGTIVEVAEAQRLLSQAEIDDALARLGIWRAMLALAAAQGDLTGYLQTAGK